jgi:hypothetical protein
MWCGVILKNYITSGVKYLIYDFDVKMQNILSISEYWIIIYFMWYLCDCSIILIHAASSTSFIPYELSTFLHKACYKAILNIASSIETAIF